MSDVRLSPRWNPKVAWCRGNQRGQIYRMVSKHVTSQEKEWQVENVHRFHKSKQILSQGWLPTTSNWYLSRQGSDMWAIFPIRLFLRIPPNSYETRRVRKDIIHHPNGNILFFQNARRSEKFRTKFARMTQQILGNQIGRNILAYIDNIVVMSIRKEDHIADLKETFTNLRSSGLNLNPKKCVFAVKEGKVLGNML